MANPSIPGTKPVHDNKQGSYMTMFSKGGFIFGVINVIGNFGTVFVDQAYWMGAIASTPSASYKGYILGGLLWFCIPFTLATSLGLASIALDLPVSSSEANAGLVPAAVAYFLMGKVRPPLLPPSFPAACWPGARRWKLAAARPRPQAGPSWSVLGSCLRRRCAGQWFPRVRWASRPASCRASKRPSSCRARPRPSTFMPLRARPLTCQPLPALPRPALLQSGAVFLTIMLFMAVTASGSAELIAVSSLFAYDGYRCTPWLLPSCWACNSCGCASAGCPARQRRPPAQAAEPPSHKKIVLEGSRGPHAGVVAATAPPCQGTH
jgi:hypothetical protein